MSSFVPIEGNAIVYCEGCFATPYGKTAHGLVRFTRRYQVVAVIDSTVSGNDAGEFLDGKSKNIPIVPDIASALETAHAAGFPATHLVLGIASDGGRLPVAARPHLIEAMQSGLNLDAGLHDFLSEDPELASVAQESGVTIRDVRRTPPRSELHSFTGKIEEVTSHVIAVLGTDSAVGKRTTAVELVRAFESAGTSAELVGTGQTSWMQGVRYQLLLDSLVSDFMAGEIEHAVWLAWHEQRPDVIVIEGQGSLMNPAYPGGYEILAAARPHAVVLQHAPARLEYDGFPGYPLDPLEKQIQAIELVSGRPVIAVTINHENLDAAGVARAAADIEKRTGLPAMDVLLEGGAGLAAIVAEHMRTRKS